jgi:hypothetical protein
MWVTLSNLTTGKTLSASTGKKLMDQIKMNLENKEWQKWLRLKKK